MKINFEFIYNFLNSLLLCQFDMQVVKHIHQLNTLLDEFRKIGAKIGFVPTMGALHNGHISLVHASERSNDISVASIYVNPTQFNDKNDLKNYPRNPDADCKLLESANCNVVFLPDNNEMYPEEDKRKFDFGKMGEVMEGKMRPGHFNGVAQVVTKLFDAVKPHRAYFGQKDFQQLAIIRKLVSDYNYPVEIIACPIIREKDGLAMSSRNTLLKKDERMEAAILYEILLKVKEMIVETEISDLQKYVETRINKTKHLRLDYLEIVNTNTLESVKKITNKIPLTACIAVYAGNVRLIDNLDLIS